mgnify:CR=1 FL=1
MNFSSFEEARRLLGLPADVSLSEIKTSYRDFLKTYHPDANPGMYGAVGEIATGSAMDAYLKLKAAYEYLIDHYDEGSTAKTVMPEDTGEQRVYQGTYSASGGVRILGS